LNLILLFALQKVLRNFYLERKIPGSDLGGISRNPQRRLNVKRSKDRITI
jgi:hypothetical protein